MTEPLNTALRKSALLKLVCSRLALENSAPSKLLPEKSLPLSSELPAARPIAEELAACADRGKNQTIIAKTNAARRRKCLIVLNDLQLACPSKPFFQKILVISLPCSGLAVFRHLA